MSDIAKDSTHWYDRAGNPVYTVKGAQGQDVTPDIRHARKFRLLPGVTGVLKVQSAPALVNWLVDQAFMAALTLPKIDGETLDAFKARAKEDSQAQSSRARDRGTEMHTALEQCVQGRPFAGEWKPHVDATIAKLREHGVDLLAGDAERSFAHPLGYGGKNDWHSHKQAVLLDYKGKPTISDKRMAYDEHIEQLAACANGLRMPECRLLNVFVGIDDQQVLVHEWGESDALRGWSMFKCALELWKLRNKYESSFTPVEIAA